MTKPVDATCHAIGTTDARWDSFREELVPQIYLMIFREKKRSVHKSKFETIPTTGFIQCVEGIVWKNYIIITLSKDFVPNH